MSKVKVVKYNIYLIRKNEDAFLYFKEVSEDRLNACCMTAATKTISGDADGYFIMRADYYLPAFNWIL